MAPRAAFDPAASYVARVGMLLGGVRLSPGDPIDPSTCSRATMKRLAEMRPPRIVKGDTDSETEGAGAAFGQTIDAGHDGAPFLPGDTSSPKRGAEGAEDSGHAVGPPALSTLQGREALPEGWRNLNGNTLRAMASRLAGEIAANKQRAIDILEGYESGRAA